MDRSSYQRAVVHATSRIRRYFASRSRDPEEIEDLTQEAIASLLESRLRYRDDSSFTTWMYAICRNVYGKHVYYAVRRRTLARSLQSEYVDRTEPPDEQSDACLERSALETALARLDAYDRRLYRLYYQERLSVLNVSTLLGRSNGTIKWQLSRLRTRLRDAILNP